MFAHTYKTNDNKSPFYHPLVWLFCTHFAFIVFLSCATSCVDVFKISQRVLKDDCNGVYENLLNDDKNFSCEQRFYCCWILYMREVFKQRYFFTYFVSYFCRLDDLLDFVLMAIDWKILPRTLNTTRVVRKHFNVTETYFKDTFTFIKNLFVLSK